MQLFLQYIKNYETKKPYCILVTNCLYLHPQKGVVYKFTPFAYSISCGWWTNTSYAAASEVKGRDSSSLPIAIGKLSGG
jgi:hypothetical protein